MGLSRRKRIAVSILIGALALLVAGELVCRFVLGLGDPPLSVAHSEIEYLFKPSAEFRRFGNRVAFNAYSMRSDEFPKQKRDPREFRLMVIGDSITNGGALVDQADIATELLKQDLAKELGRPVVVGNISAGSWGPPNQLAYVRHFGLFDADSIVIVVNKDDYADVPADAPVVGIHPSFPDRAPWFALTEGISRYLIGRWKRSGSDGGPTGTAEERISAVESALSELLEQCRSKAPTAVFYYPVPAETAGDMQPGFHHVRKIAEEADVDWIDLTSVLRQAISAGTPVVHPNDIHPNETGQRIIAEAIEQWVLSQVNESGSSP